MSLTPRLVAIQGIGFTPIEIAIQGLLEELAKEKIVGGYAKGHVNYAKRRDRLSAEQEKAAAEESAKNYADRLNREYQRKLRLQRDDVLATEFIMAVLQSELLHG